MFRNLEGAAESRITWWLWRRGVWGGGFSALSEDFIFSHQCSAIYSCRLRFDLYTCKWNKHQANLLCEPFGIKLCVGYRRIKRRENIVSLNYLLTWWSNTMKEMFFVSSSESPGWTHQSLWSQDKQSLCLLQRGKPEMPWRPVFLNTSTFYLSSV